MNAVLPGEPDFVNKTWVNGQANVRVDLNNGL